MAGQLGLGLAQMGLGGPVLRVQLDDLPMAIGRDVLAERRREKDEPRRMIALTFASEARDRHDARVLRPALAYLSNVEGPGGQQLDQRLSGH